MSRRAKKLIIIGLSLIVGIWIAGDLVAKAVLYEISDHLNSRDQGKFIVEYRKSRFNLFTGKVSILDLHINPSDSSKEKLPFIKSKQDK